MATTTNYGWTTPDDTALVKDGASAIRTLGSSVDTTVKALNPGTTSGDLDYYTAATTKARIAKGTAGQVFTMNSGATAPEWQTISAGGMTSIASGSLSGTSISLTSISGTYNDLLLILRQPTVSASAGGATMVRTNNISTSTYSITYWIATGTSFTTYTTRTAHWANDLNGTTSANNNFVAYRFLDYANATTLKQVQISGVNGTQATFGIAYNTGITSAITRLDILDNNGASYNGGTYVLYGIK